MNEWKLVSHGFSKRCRICEMERVHPKWHDFAQCALNPVALVGVLEAMRDRAPEAIDAVIGYVVGVTGLDVQAANAATAAESVAPPVDEKATQG